jgi:NAD-dependent dihydropyrimidine dehydrogenase PreA subunit
MKQAYLKNVVTLELDRQKCTGCGRCLEVCPHNVFQKDNGKVMIANRDSCMECGACTRNCPVAAVTVRPGVGCAYGITLGVLNNKEAACGESGDCGGGACCG